MVQIAFLDVGNADSIVITQPEHAAIVVDAPRPRRVSEWLQKQECSSISALFFTHDHRDHIPSLGRLVTFATDWLRKGTLEQLFLPTGYLERAKLLIKDKASEARFRHALDKLALWDGTSVSIERAEKRASPLQFADVHIKMLHPSTLFVQQLTQKMVPNELSLVLRLEYKGFSTLLLGDIEGKGIDTLLGNTHTSDLKCNIVKVPHHGAWQTQNAARMRKLLDACDAELAVLSVGSKNAHKHVAPGLFEELLNQMGNENRRMCLFVCTELTRTCVHTKEERAQMNKMGLQRKRPCGGDITIQVGANGNWTYVDSRAHSERILEVERPACLGKADL